MRTNGYTYIMMNPKRNVIYTGVTANLQRRVYQHKTGFNPESFTNRYNCKDLVYYEIFPAIKEAIMREKQLKKWKRPWKLELIKGYNPYLVDLYGEVQKYDLT